MKSKSYFWELILIIFSLVIFFSCTKKTTDTENIETTEIILQTDVSEQTEMTSVTAGEIPPVQTEEDEIAALKNVRVYTEEDFKNIEPIFDIDMVLVEGGSMEMRGKMVSLDSFYMNKYELTNQMAKRAYIWGTEQGFMDGEYYFNLDKTDYSINIDSFLDSILLCNYLSILDGYKPVYYKENGEEPVLHIDNLYKFVGDPAYGDIELMYFPVIIDWEADGYRLPTEAEWEFAARGGIHSKGYTYAGSNNLDEVAWFNTYIKEMNIANVELYTNIPAGQKKSNELGLYDMSGNTAEWIINPWQPEDMLIPKHNPGRLSRIIESNVLLTKGGDIDSFSLNLYDPRFRTIVDSRNEGADDLEVNNNYDSIISGKGAMPTIRLVRSKLN